MKKAERDKRIRLRRKINAKSHERNLLSGNGHAMFFEKDDHKEKLRVIRPNNSGSSLIKYPREYISNHYVPEWYQRRFLSADENSFSYLDLRPDMVMGKEGHIYYSKDLQKWGPVKCFCQDDLYTMKFQGVDRRDIEKLFFGEIDSCGKEALDYFANYNHLKIDYENFEKIILYMTTQKLRTPKGLGWLATLVGSEDSNIVLSKMLELRRIYGAIWSECIWQVADASMSPVKFIISDQPVTVYNRVCGPKSQKCRGYNDPDVFLNGTHTIFPLSLDKILILTNLSWVRNPYQSSITPRPNPLPWRSAIFKYQDVQIGRQLSEEEVWEINYIIKRRAFRYIAAAKKEWLYPEEHIMSTDWSSYGSGYLLMPDPRSIHMGGTIYMGNDNGPCYACDEYGYTPGQLGFEDKGRRDNESFYLEKFKQEFTRLFGDDRRGRSYRFQGGRKVNLV